MNVAEELHKIVGELSEEQPQHLLEVANQLLAELTEEEEDAEYQSLLGELLMKRYEHYKAHPETGISAADASHRIRLKYGWLK